MIYHIHRGAERDNYSLHDLDACVQDTVEALRPRRAEFDTIATQGISGVVVAAPVSIILQKELTVVRKDTDQSHQSSRVIGGSGIVSGKRVLFLDDFISMGRTRSRVAKHVRDAGGQVVATYTYQNDEYEREAL